METESHGTDLSDVLKNVWDNDAAPIIYFDNVPLRGGQTVFNIPLTCYRTRMVDSVVVTNQVIVAHLRCNREAAMSLKAALTDLLKALPLKAAPQGRAS